ncbi:glycoside hydrolase family protein [Marinilabilia rubra]|uniref:Exo-alpha-sialidase n=1 Tax=Marinilabilia rubra TaxID=2162893 RepID=A0A2U2B8H2_9BACT|nr:glycoside hydrolase family protein [Marinilabilia rubra]PWD99343.1 hypothetical protein DDZ16_10040 [Marinilabilia rubra]
MKKLIFFTLCIVSFSFIKAADTDDEKDSFQFAKLSKDVKDNFMKGNASANVLVDPDYYVWGLSVIKWSDGKYHCYYSRWPKSVGFNGWLTDCEIAHAISDRPEGPFLFESVVLESRNSAGWDVLTSHNPSVCIAGDKLCLYYISNDMGQDFEDLSAPMNLDFRKENWKLIRNNQRIGVAIATDPSGPFIRSENPVVEPDNKLFKNIAVNPAVTYVNGKFTMIMKGDDVGEDKWFRIQLVGHADNPQGPFYFENKPVYDKKQTEDAGIWYDSSRQTYYMTCHVLGLPDLALFTSKNSYQWQPASQPVLMKKEFLLDNGEIWKPKRVERPFVLTDDNGKPVMLYVAVSDNGITGNIAVPFTDN